jgi:hypothetical protein
MPEYTPRFKLPIPDFLQSPWIEALETTFNSIDTALYNALLSNAANWANSTAYAIGDVVIDNVANGELYVCAVAHTSPATPTTFATYRTSNPTHWNAAVTIPAFRGTWQTATLYTANDFVVDNGRYAVAAETHTSGVFNTDLAANKWTVLIDVSGITSGAINSTDWTNLASDTETDLGGVSSSRLNITGTTTIESFGTATNTFKILKFNDALILTNNNPALLLLDNANRTTAANDVMFVASDASGNWRELFYSRFVPIATQGEAETGTNNTKLMTPLRTAQASVAGLALKAPVAAQYVTLALDGTLTAERVLTAGVGISLTDAGANGAATLRTTFIRRAITGADTIIGTDHSKMIEVTSGTFTLALTAAATLTSSFYCLIANYGTGVVTIDADGAEQIDGATTATLRAGELILLQCTGTAFETLALSRVQIDTFTSNGTYNKPVWAKWMQVHVVGGGGGGGGGRGGAAGSTRSGGGGGGGGAGVIQLLNALLVGASESVTVGAAGSNGAGGSSGDGTAGGVGGVSSFGTLIYAHGGGGGGGGTTASDIGGGGGGGEISPGGAGSAGAAGVAGAPDGGVAGALSGSSRFGGGAGGVGDDSVATDGFKSVHGGGGGGGGEGVTSGNTEGTGREGGASGPTTTSTAGTPGSDADGGAGGAANGGAGTNGAAGAGLSAGSGGGGGGGQDSGTGGAGGNGGAPGGGGGGGGGGTTTGGAGGAGGVGEVRVWTYG